jgi:hypothetical protein
MSIAGDTAKETPNLLHGRYRAGAGRSVLYELRPPRGGPPALPGFF